MEVPAVVREGLAARQRAELRDGLYQRMNEVDGTDEPSAGHSHCGHLAQTDEASQVLGRNGHSAGRNCLSQGQGVRQKETLAHGGHLVP
jgi:hypothetical protein